jgi:transposase-like protein
MARSIARPDTETLGRLYHREGLTIAAIAARFGVAAQTVHNWLVAGGVDRRPSPATRRAELGSGEIVRLYTHGGHTAAEIAQRLGCSPSLVYARLDLASVPRRSQAPRRRVRPDNRELAELYTQQRLSLRHVAHRYGVSPQAVRDWLVAAGIPRRPSRTPPASGGGHDIVGLYQAGWSGPAIAQHLGCSPATIYRHLDGAGVARRTVTAHVTRSELIGALEHGQSAPAMADHFGVSVACVCRALLREGLMTARQTARKRRRQVYPEAYPDPTADGVPATVSVEGNP